VKYVFTVGDGRTKVEDTRQVVFHDGLYVPEEEIIRTHERISGCSTGDAITFSPSKSSSFWGFFNRLFQAEASPPPSMVILCCGAKTSMPVTHGWMTKYKYSGQQIPIPTLDTDTSIWSVYLTLKAQMDVCNVFTMYYTEYTEKGVYYEFPDPCSDQYRVENYTIIGQRNHAIIPCVLEDRGCDGRMELKRPTIIFPQS